MDKLYLLVIIVFIILYLSPSNIEGFEVPTLPVNEIYDLNRHFYYIFNRGIFIPDPQGFKNLFEKLDDIFFADHMKQYRERFGRSLKTKLLGKDVTLLMDRKVMIKILEKSPFQFGPSTLKVNLFNQFMPDNLGISTGCPWKRRRVLNEIALGFKDNSLFFYKIRDVVNKSMPINPPKNYDDFFHLGNRIAFQITFGNMPFNSAPNDMLRAAQTMRALLGFSIDSKVKKRYDIFIEDVISNPRDGSLVKWAMDLLAANKLNINKKEFIGQIPHWYFPIRGISANAVPGFITVMLSHPKKMDRLMSELSEHISYYTDDNTYLQMCMLEFLRLFNNVNTLTRQALVDIEIDGLKFKKGEEIFILFADLLRDENRFQYPNQFIPERWYGIPRSHHNFPFSFGNQTCPGFDIALFLFKAIVIQLLLQNDYKLKKPLNTSAMPYLMNPFGAGFDVSSNYNNYQFDRDRFVHTY